MDRPSLLTDAWQYAASVYQVASTGACLAFEAAQHFANEFNQPPTPHTHHIAENGGRGLSVDPSPEVNSRQRIDMDAAGGGRVGVPVDGPASPLLDRAYNYWQRAIQTASEAYEAAQRICFESPAVEEPHDRSVFRSSDISAVPQVDPEHKSARTSWTHLGSGGFGKVYVAEMGANLVAVKVMHEDLGPEKTAQFLKACKRELHAMHALTHPAIVQLIGYLPSTDAHPIPRIVMEFMENKTMHDLIHTVTPLPISLAARLTLLKQVAHAIRFMHTRGYVHRDVKMENILLSNNFKIAKLGDLGIAATCISTMTNCVGTSPYMAPEVYDVESKKYGTSADVYSFAIILWETITKEKPYPNMNSTNQVSYLYEILTKGLRPRALRENEADVHLRDIVKRCWSGDPSRRMTMDEILAHLIGRDEEERETRVNDAVEGWLAGQTTPENYSDAEES